MSLWDKQDRREHEWMHSLIESRRKNEPGLVAQMVTLTTGRLGHKNHVFKASLGEIARWVFGNRGWGCGSVVGCSESVCQVLDQCPVLGEKHSTGYNLRQTLKLNTAGVVAAIICRSDGHYVRTYCVLGHLPGHTVQLEMSN